MKSNGNIFRKEIVRNEGMSGVRVREVAKRWLFMKSYSVTFTWQPYSQRQRLPVAWHGPFLLAATRPLPHRPHHPSLHPGHPTPHNYQEKLLMVKFSINQTPQPSRSLLPLSAQCSHQCSLPSSLSIFNLVHYWPPVYADIAELCWYSFGDVVAMW